MDLSAWRGQAYQMVLECIDAMHAYTGSSGEYAEDGITGWELWDEYVKEKELGSYEFFKQCLKQLVDAGIVVPTGKSVQRPSGWKKATLASRLYRISDWANKYWARHGDALLHPEENVHARYVVWRDRGRPGVWRRIPIEFLGEVLRDSGVQTATFMKARISEDKAKDL